MKRMTVMRATCPRCGLIVEIDEDGRHAQHYAIMRLT